METMELENATPFESPPDPPPVFKYELFEKTIMGIIYYTDAHNNLFHIQDVVDKKTNPAVVGKWYSTDKEDKVVIY